MKFSKETKDCLRKLLGECETSIKTPSTSDSSATTATAVTAAISATALPQTATTASNTELASVLRLLLSDNISDRENGIRELQNYYSKGLLNNKYNFIFLLGLFYHNNFVNDDFLDPPESRKKACELYRIAADNGQADAQNNLGNYYKNGVGVTENRTEAFRYYSLAAAQGHTIGLFNVGHCFCLGIGVERDIDKAVVYYTKALNQGYTEANKGLLDCANHYLMGFYAKKDPAKYIELSLFARQPEFIKTLTEKEAAAASGNANAQYFLGNIYETGSGINTDLAQALKYYEQAKANGHPLATYSVQYFTLNKLASSSTALQRKTFNKYQTLAKDDGVQSAAHNALGFCYQFGVGTDEDAKKAVEHYHAAAKDGHIMALTALGQCYQYGIGVTNTKGSDTQAENFKKAGEYYAQAMPRDTEHAFSQASYNFGIHHRIRLQIMTVAEQRQHFTQYCQHATGGNTAATNHAGFCCQKGIGTTPDARSAFRLFSVAANRGDADALFNQGVCYLDGSGTRVDTVAGYRSYLAAARKRHIPALHKISLPYKNFGQDVCHSLLTAYRNLQKEKVKLTSLIAPNSAANVTSMVPNSPEHQRLGDIDVEIDRFSSIMVVNGAIKLFFQPIFPNTAASSSVTTSTTIISHSSSSATTNFVFLPNELCDTITDYVGLLEGDEAEARSNTETNANTSTSVKRLNNL